MITVHLQPLKNLHWRVVRVVEGARLESVYTSKGYRGFESLTLRKRQRDKGSLSFFLLTTRPQPVKIFHPRQQTL